MNDKQVLQDVAFNPAAKCSPTATQCPRCNNPHNACDKDAQPAGKDAWLVEAERLAQLHACEKSLRHLGREDADETKTLAALLAHLRSHTAPEGFALVPVDLIAVFKHQRQCDEEGIEVAVSRQAVCELIDLLAAAGKENS